MSAVLGVGLLIFKILGIALLVLLALAAVLLLVPAAVRLDWHGDALTIRARVLFLHFTLYPRPQKADRESGAGKSAAKKKKAEKKPPKKSGKAAAGEKEKTEEAPDSFVKGLLRNFKKNPFGMLRQLLSYAGDAGGILLRGLRIRHVVILWPVTGEDAADTALVYGRTLGFANGVWNLAQNSLNIRADQLTIEPDFTGEAEQKRQIACQIAAQPCIMVAAGIYLLYKAFHDPVLHPKA